MDILHSAAKSIWEWMGVFPCALTAFFTRCAVILLLCVFFGQGVKHLAQKGLRNTLPLQIGAFIVAVIIGLSLPLHGIQNMSIDGRNMLLSVSFFLSVLLPYAAVCFMIRRHGHQQIALKLVYLVEGILFFIQIITLNFR